MAEIKVILDAELPEQFQASNMYRVFGTAAEDATVEAFKRAFKRYCTANHIFYYARPHESFFQSEAIELAAAAGCTAVLLEDMS